MKRKLILGLILAVGSASGLALWRVYDHYEKKSIEANNTPFFQWTRDQASSDLVLNIQRNPDLNYQVVSAPTVVVSGPAVIIGKPGTVEPGAFVQIVNKRSGKLPSTVVADEKGAFSMKMTVEAGDTLSMTTFKPPQVIRSEGLTVQSQPPAR